MGYPGLTIMETNDHPSRRDFFKTVGAGTIATAVVAAATEV